MKNIYNGKKLINEIYKKSFNKDIKLDEFNIINLIINTQLDSTLYKTIYLNKTNEFYDAILNKYWPSLTEIKYEYIKGEKEVNIYNLKGYRLYTNPERREDFINKEIFKTGDILIYINKNDATYSVDKSKNILIKNDITYGDGEYSYIYIEGKGLIGVNLGNDRLKNTIDDRNKFNAQYYKNNNLPLYILEENPSDEFLEIANIQTLFGKDYYVILRPSLCFDFIGNNNNDNNNIGIDNNNNTNKRTIRLSIIILYLLFLL